MSEPDLIERLADRVHQAWMEAKQAQGFADHPWTAGQHAMVTIERGDVRPACDKCTLPQRLHHPDMRPYADLDEPTKEYDRATARAVLGSTYEDAEAVVRALLQMLPPERRGAVVAEAAADVPLARLGAAYLEWDTAMDAAWMRPGRVSERLADSRVAQANEALADALSAARGGKDDGDH